jgi:hypothetical protein
MDPAALASAVVSVLGPYVTKGVEEFTKAAGEVAYEKAKQLLATLKTRWVGDAAAADQLARFEKKPEVYAPVLKDVLEEKIQQDSQLAIQLEQTVKQMGPSLQIFIKMAQGEDVTALEADEMTKGQVNVNIDIGSGKRITGPKIKHIG